MKKLFQALALLAAFVLLIALPQTAADGVRSALTLCGRVILPSLFPFFVCSNLFLLLGYSARLSARFGGAAAKLLRLPPQRAARFCWGFSAAIRPARRRRVRFTREGSCPERNAERALAVSAIRRGRRSSSRTRRRGLQKRGGRRVFVRSADRLCRARLPSDREKTVRARQSRREAAAAGILCRSLFRIGAPRGDERDPDLYVYHGFFRAHPLFSACRGRFLPPEALPLVLGSLELSAGCAALADCALALQWKLCIASALLSFGGVSVLAQSRAAVAGARPDREAAPAMQGASGRAFPARLRSSPRRCCTRKAGPPPPFPARKARKRRERRLCCCAR